VIYWGSSSGFSSSSATLSIPAGGHGVSVADLNKDGYLDLVSTGWYDAYSFIYWGGASGYSAGNMQILIPGSCYGGSAVADINDDTYLDILYHRGGYGPDYQKVFWGSASGYSNNNYSDLGMPLETTGGLIADLDFDGDLDIFVNTRTPEYMSYVFSAPSFASTAALPVNQYHHAMFREIGNVYNREYYEDYISSVFEAGGNADWGTIEWDASLPTGSSIMFWIRTGNTPNLDDAWLDWTPFSSGESIPDAFNARYLQYKARLIYTNPCYFPSLEEVRVTYTSSEEAVSNEEVQCSPNPLRNSTMISFPARGSTDASVKIYSINGQLVRNLDAIEYKEAVGVVIWDRKDDGGRRVPAGVYFYAVKDQETSHTGKVIVFD
jgi:hypothetical protein